MLDIDVNDSYVIIEDTVFKNGRFGALKIVANAIEIQSCIFINNTIIKNFNLNPSKASTLTLKSKSNYIKNSQFINNTAYLYQILINVIGSNSNKGALISNTTIESGNYENTTINIPIFIEANDEWAEFERSVFLDTNTTIQCKSGQTIEYDYSQTSTYLSVRCKQCDISTYNVKDLANFRVENVEYQIIATSNVTCHKCPYQATCVDGIKSKGNYWGFIDPSGEVIFVLCPPSYCCFSSRTCTSYDTCYENRSGRLCSKCLAEHVLSLFSHNVCVSHLECQKSFILWLVYIIIIILVCLFLLYSKTVWNLLKSRIGKGERNRRRSAESLTSPLLDQTEVNEPSSCKAEFNFSGIAKTAFFFYQTASIIRIKASAKNEYTTTKVIGYLTSVFNIRIDVTKGILTFCPLDTANVVVMEFFRSSIPFACLILISFLMLLTKIKSMIRKHQTTDAFHRGYGM